MATNLDLFPDRMPVSIYARKPWRLLRLPDKPTIEDLKSIGVGYDGEYNEGREGLIVLDECASWLNSRNWSNQGRFELIEWFVHARKLRWDMILIIQDVDGLDSQCRKFLMEFKVRCYKGKNLPIIRWLPFKFHVASVRTPLSHSDIKVETWIYRGSDLY